MVFLTFSGVTIVSNIEVATEDKPLTYVPFGETKPITLTLKLVRTVIAVPTKSGAMPTTQDLLRFMMLCQARELNPWVGDAYLVGYDGKDGPVFSLITAIQALLKRAEANPNFDGIASGIVVADLAAGTFTERPGNLLYPKETLWGGWARVWRKDRAHNFYDSLNLSTYNTGRSQWSKDPAGMIDKVAQASVLRSAFPTQLGSLYIEQERGAIERGDGKESPAISHAASPAQLTPQRQVMGSDFLRPVGQAEPMPVRHQQAPAVSSSAAVPEPAADEPPAPAETAEQPEAEQSAESPREVMPESWMLAKKVQIENTRTIADLNGFSASANAVLNPDQAAQVVEWCQRQIANVRSKRAAQAVLPGAPG